jgi:hypothetical protein
MPYLVQQTIIYYSIIKDRHDVLELIIMSVITNSYCFLFFSFRTQSSQHNPAAGSCMWGDTVYQKV